MDRPVKLGAVRGWQRGPGAVGALGVMTLALAGCVGAPSAADGAVVHVCGQIINQVPAIAVGSPPWYVDATTGHGRRLLLPVTRVFAPGFSTWVRVSHSCAVGATVTLTPAGDIRTAEVVRAVDGGEVAVRLQGVRPGAVTVTAESRGRIIGSLAVTVGPLPAPTG